MIHIGFRFIAQSWKAHTAAITLIGAEHALKKYVGTRSTQADQSRKIQGKLTEHELRLIRHLGAMQAVIEYAARWFAQYLSSTGNLHASRGSPH